MSGIWYCRSCGYEVDKGGRCHNCHQPLIETELTELYSTSTRFSSRCRPGSVERASIA